MHGPVRRSRISSQQPGLLRRSEKLASGPAGKACEMILTALLTVLIILLLLCGANFVFGLHMLDSLGHVSARLDPVRRRLGYRLRKEHRRSQEGLRERERYLARMLTDSSEAMIVTDNAHRLLAANRAALALFGISDKNLNNFTIDAFLRHDQVHCFEREGPPFIQSPERLGECQIRPLHGKPRKVEFSFQANVLLNRHLSKFRNIETRQ
jgi:PAS domain-containing protein